MVKGVKKNNIVHPLSIQLAFPFWVSEDFANCSHMQF